MIKILIVTVSLLIGGANLFGQNLVKNSSFEGALSPVSISGWQGRYATLNSTIGTAPTSVLGHEVPVTGNGYIGMVLWSALNPQDHNWACGELTSQILPGTQVDFSAYISLADESAFYGGFLGVYLSKTKPDSTEIFSNQVNSMLVPVIQDTSSWSFIASSFIVSDTVNYVSLRGIGAMAGPAGGTTFQQGAFYFVDDVCITSNNDCSVITSIIDETRKEKWEIVELTDLLGRSVNGELPPGTVVIETSRSNLGRYRNRKILFVN